MYSEAIELHSPARDVRGPSLTRQLQHGYYRGNPRQNRRNWENFCIYLFFVASVALADEYQG